MIHLINFIIKIIATLLFVIIVVDVFAIIALMIWDFTILDKCTEIFSIIQNKKERRKY